MGRQLHRLPRVLALVGVVAAAAGLAACGRSGTGSGTPGLAGRDTVVTTVRPVRQDLTNRVSLTGTVTLDPVFGLSAPVDGQVRYLDVKPPQGTPTKPTRVATVKSGDGRSHDVDVPAGAVFAGRLVDDRSTVTAGTPIVSATRDGYGIVANINGAQAYQIADALDSVQAQITGGPGPFACTPLGAIAALPAGVVPAQPPPAGPPAGPTGAPGQGPVMIAPTPPDQEDGAQGSDATGLRLVCTAPAGVRLINGADATVQVVTATAANVLTLPVEAVAGRQGQGKVDVVMPDGSRQTRDVVLGLTDGKVVEIKSGLTGDETVAVPGPNLPTPPPNTGGRAPRA